MDTAQTTVWSKRWLTKLLGSSARKLVGKGVPEPTYPGRDSIWA